MGDPLDSGARQSRSTSESSTSLPCTGVPGTEGGPRTSTAIRPWTRRSAAESPATSLITTRNSAWPCTFEPVRDGHRRARGGDPDVEVGQLLGAHHRGDGVADARRQVRRQVDRLGLAGPERGDPDRRQRRGRRLDHPDPDAPGVAVVGRDPQGAGVAGLGAGRGGHLDDAGHRTCPQSAPEPSRRRSPPTSSGRRPGPGPRSTRGTPRRCRCARTPPATPRSGRRGSAGSDWSRRPAPASDRVALMPSGSSTLVPVVTSKTTAPGPAYPSLAATRNEPVAR